MISFLLLYDHKAWGCLNLNIVVFRSKDGKNSFYLFITRGCRRIFCTCSMLSCQCYEMSWFSRYNLISLSPGRTGEISNYCSFAPCSVWRQQYFATNKAAIAVSLAEEVERFCAVINLFVFISVLSQTYRRRWPPPCQVINALDALFHAYLRYFEMNKKIADPYRKKLAAINVAIAHWR